MVPGCRVRQFRDRGGKRPAAGNGGPAMTVTVSVTVTQVREDGTAGPLEEELAAALAGPVEQFSSMLTWTAQQAAPLDHGDREKVIAEPGRELLADLAGDLAAWVDEFYDQRAFGADTDLPATDVIMMQAGGKGIALRPEHRKGAGKDSDSAHPGIKKMAEIVAVADFTPAVRDPGDIA